MNETDPFGTQNEATWLTAELSAGGLTNAHEIGRGGFGVVYRCTQTSLDRTVAVKVLLNDLSDVNHERFFREQHAMGRLTSHPGIVTALQVGVTASGKPFIVMPYHPRGSLEAKIRGDGPLPEADVLKIGVELADALAAAHYRGVIHRDVKPANVLLTEYGTYALGDFGIARIPNGFETATGIISGSPAFTAPEVLRGSTPGPLSDIYGLGATLFCALTGHAAFERRSGEQMVTQFIRITTEPTPDLRDRGVADDVAALLEHALSHNPDSRQPSAEAFGEQCHEIQQRREQPGDPDNTLERSKKLNQSSHSWFPTFPPHGDSGNLPEELSSFIGRRQEITEAKRLLATSRLLTLVGIGGVGKTRLAVRLGADVRREFTHGVWLVELDEVRSPSRLIDVIAATFGIRDQPDHPLRESVLNFLCSREMLLILDNCEQATGIVADFTTVLLQQNPKLRILATSRESLSTSAEATLRVPPLTVPVPGREPSLQGLPRYGAISLFAERASTSLATFTLTDTNKSAVARICRILDGLPLPIELAAAQISVMSPEQILQRLSNRYALLTRGKRSSPSRQQTLRLCVDWSFDLCSRSEQRAWTQLSIFAASFDLDAAEYLCGNSLRTVSSLECVTSLVDKSILIREEYGPEVRFKLLDTLREYGLEKAQSGEEFDDLQRRHRDWYRRLTRTAAAEFVSPRQLEWIARFSNDQPNLREAMDYCHAEGDSEAGLEIATPLLLLWGARGQLSETRRWIDRFLSLGSSPITITIRALYANCFITGQQRDHQAAAAFVQEARTLVDQTADPVAHAIVDHADGLVALFNGDLQHGISTMERALSVFRLVEEELALRLECLTLLGLAYQLYDTQPSRALVCYEEVLAISTEHGESVYRSYALWAMAIVHWNQGDQIRAMEVLSQGLRLAQLADDPVSCANSLEVFAWIAGSGDPRRASVLMGAAKAHGGSAGTPPVFVPHLLQHHDACESATRRSLTTLSFEQSWRQGQNMSLDSAVAYALNEPRKKVLGSVAHLTQREQQVADLVAEGLTNKAIAARLVISQRTAQGHVEHILTKLGFTSRSQIAAWVVEERALS